MTRDGPNPALGAGFGSSASGFTIQELWSRKNARRSFGPEKVPRMPRLRTVVIATAVIVVTDVTWDGTSLHVSFGWPGRKPVASFTWSSD
jgi:hypothetical protein